MKLSTVVLCTFTFATASFAAEDDLDIPFEEFRLDNGLRVIVH